MSENIVKNDFVRGIETVTSEICVIKDQTQRIVLQSAIEIGRRLIEAKAMVPYGEWGNYLKEQVDFSQSTANNMMKIAEQYGSEQMTIFGLAKDSQTLANLPYTKALKLLAMPAEEREVFVETHDVDSMSTRELEKVIRERDEARQQLQDTCGKLDTTQRELAHAQSVQTELQDKLTKAQSDVKAADDEAVQNERELKAEIERLKLDLEKKQEAEKKAKAKLKELKDNPEIPQDVMDRIKAEAETAAKEKSDGEIQKAISVALEKQKAAEQAAELARKETEHAAAKLEDMQKQIKAANTDVAVFKLWFDRVQEDWNRMQGALLKVASNDSDTAEKLRVAVSAVLEQWQGA